MSAYGHLTDPMSGRQYPDASERTISGARVTRPVVPSRGFDVEAGTEDREKARACCDEFNRRIASHPPRQPQDDGTAYDESGTVATASNVGSLCFVVLIGCIGAGGVVYALGLAFGWWVR